VQDLNKVAETLLFNKRLFYSGKNTH